jgi:uncharacterized repeat protein (TIGR01451 family)
MKVLAALAGVALLALAPLAVAQQKAAQPLETRIEQRKVARAADGAESLVPADAVKPGDVIEYAVTYRNTGKPALTKLEATLPIPAQTEYVPGSVRPANAKASTDGRTFGDLPLKRAVKRNGVDVEEIVPLTEYRFLRWYPGELAGEKAVTYTARVRVTEIRNPNK